MRADYDSPWMMNLSAPPAVAFRQDLERFEEERHMPYVTSIERMALVTARVMLDQFGIANPTAFASKLQKAG